MLIGKMSTAAMNVLSITAGKISLHFYFVKLDIEPFSSLHSVYETIFLKAHS